jgi:hypothetical protein
MLRVGARYSVGARVGPAGKQRAVRRLRQQPADVVQERRRNELNVARVAGGRERGALHGVREEADRAAAPQLAKNRNFLPYLAGIKTWKDEPSAEPEHSAAAGAGAGGDFTQAAGDYADAEEEEAEYAAEREAVAAAQKKAHAQAEKLKQQAAEAKEAEEELKKQQAALKKKQDEAATRKAEAAQAVLDAAKARAQEQQQQPQQPPSAKKSKTPFTDFYGTLKPEQQKELYEAGVCDDKGKFSKKQTLNKATREEFKVSQLNALAELDAINKNW